MKYIELSGKKGAGLRTIVNDDDYALLSGYKWYINGLGYAIAYLGGGRVSQKLTTLHRFLTDCPQGMTVDHINHDKLDNRRSNLRICSMGNNVRNNRPRRHKMSSPYKGVTVSKQSPGKFIAQICRREGSKTVSQYLGTFGDQTEAARAYDGAAKKLFGEYAFLNFP